MSYCVKSNGYLPAPLGQLGGVLGAGLDSGGLHSGYSGLIGNYQPPLGNSVVFWARAWVVMACMVATPLVLGLAPLPALEHYFTSHSHDAVLSSLTGGYCQIGNPTTAQRFNWASFSGLPATQWRRTRRV